MKSWPVAEVMAMVTLSIKAAGLSFKKAIVVHSSPVDELIE